MYLPILGPQVGLNKALEADLFRYDHHQVFDSVLVAFAVTTDHTAGGDSGKGIAIRKGCFEGFTANVLPIYVYS